MKSIKIIEGKAFVCEEITVNPNAKHPDWDFRYNVSKCINAVCNRMADCMKQLEEAVANNAIYEISHGGIRHTNGYFGIKVYEAMESLTAKLQVQAPKTAFVDINWIENNLSAIEADQLFKAYVVTIDHFDHHAMRLLDAVIVLQSQATIDK